MTTGKRTTGCNVYLSNRYMDIGFPQNLSGDLTRVRKRADKEGRRNSDSGGDVPDALVEGQRHMDGFWFKEEQGGGQIGEEGTQ